MEEIETGSFLAGQVSPDQPDIIRIVSWNINRGLQLDGIIEFLARSSADLILIQEADINARRTDYRNVPREIARALQMSYVFGREFEELAQGNCTSRAFHGQATLSRFPLSDSRIIRFRRQSNFWQPRWYIPQLQMFQRRLGARLALISQVKVRDRLLAVYNVHLESRGSEDLRCDQLSEVLADIRRHIVEMPAIIAGDFNFDLRSEPASAVLGTMQLNNPFARSGGCPTIVGHRSGKARAIDWILTTKALRADIPTLHNSISASDHYPLSLQLRFTAKSE